MRNRATVGDVLLDGLRAWGVCHVFGRPDPDGPVSAWARADDDPCLVGARREETAAFEAVGYATFSGHVGVCAAPSAPGAVRLLRGLCDARPDGVPVVALLCADAAWATTIPAGGDAAPPGRGRVSADRASQGRASQGRISPDRISPGRGAGPRAPSAGPCPGPEDPRALLEAVAAASLETVTGPEEVPGALDRAVRAAYEQRAPAVLVVPADVLEQTCPPPGHAPGARPSSLDAGAPAPVPDDRSLERVAALLEAGERVAILVGLGAAGAAREVQEVAERLGAGVAKAMPGLDALSDELPYVTGAIGPLGTGPSSDLVQECDTLLAVGSRFPQAAFLPPYGQARAVRLDSGPDPVASRYPYDISLVGDAAATLRRLLALLTPRTERPWQERVATGVRGWRAALARRAALDADPVNPEYVARALDPLLPDDAMITCDAGPVAAWYAGHLRLRQDMRGALSAPLAGPGGAVPYAVGAKFAHPGRPAIALVGDGAPWTGGLSELATAARYADEWTDPRLVVAVWNTRGPGPCGRPSPPDADHVAFARSLGLYGVGVSSPEEVTGAWRTALAADRPTLLDFRTAPTATGDAPTTVTATTGAVGRLPRPGRPVGLRSVPPGCAAHGP
ncbi:pyruvate dehydrogenase (quinone) [Streptomyces sp. PanSC19]|uniref:thiamine pyrophosphate-dependent enzyme n=1 Tax=Streptomyces sp. PanSC19 TaxID=1520455 RepID=UPI000F47252D|nr:thiamine pyrophosphate-dependent enzyme [Streptomyces sp. PanSC19]ROQ35587.1 pyruvate dehydrogenase (quinone) [Streptomyces sp. PanSC19]